MRNMRWRDQLCQKQLDLLQPFDNEIGIPRAHWLEGLCAWLRLYERRPRCFKTTVGLNKAELEEHLQYRRCIDVRRLLKENALSQRHLDMLEPFRYKFHLCNSTSELKRRAWLEDTCAWLRLYKRSPCYIGKDANLNETELQEQLQYRRCNHVRTLMRRSALSKEHLDVLQPVLKVIQPSNAELVRTAWLEDLCAWLRLHKRRPRWFRTQVGLNQTELQEKLQHRRCSEVRKLLRRNALSKEQLDVLQPFQSKIEARSPSRAADRRSRADWLEDLCDWLRFHGRRPRAFGTLLDFAIFLCPFLILVLQWFPFSEHMSNKLTLLFAGVLSLAKEQTRN